MIDNAIAAKPWAHNRKGDPKQFLHKAELLEKCVVMRRADAARTRAEANAIDAGADQMAEAARDYRAWAHKSTENV